MCVRAIVGVIVGLTIAVSPAGACNGNEIFSDDFSDVQISKDVWNLGDRATVSQGYMELKAQPGLNPYVPIPVRLNDFELCVDIVSPKARPRQEDQTAVGFTFWLKDWEAFTYVPMTFNGVLAPMRRTNGRALPLATARAYDAIRKGPGARNSFRLAVKGNVTTVYANDQRLVSFRSDTTDATGWIFLFAQSPGGPTIWRFANIKLTDPPK